MSRGADIIARRGAARLHRAEAAWAEIRPQLDALGVEHRLFGSFARSYHGADTTPCNAGGDSLRSKSNPFRAHSDIDLMILGDPEPGVMGEIDLIVGAASDRFGIPFDLIFAKFIDKEAIDAILTG